jgi:3-deoxy-manno-octulosonate cytidylyltransferase (CMP-KDO synthetase)
MKVLGVIPARYASRRFEGKALADLLGKPMIQHVYERASRAETLDGLMVATDDQRIFEAVRGFNGEVVMTAEHPTGTDRIAEVAGRVDAEILVNVQGDEPLIEPAMIDEAVEPLLRNTSIDLGTLVHRIHSEAEYLNPNVVKVVVDRSGFAMYFSRSSIPHVKSGGWGEPGGEPESQRTGKPEGRKAREPESSIQHQASSIQYPLAYRHVGLYVYSQHVLLDFAQMPPAPLEMLEGLEQLRFLENGYRMKVVETRHESVGVDMPEDWEKVRSIMSKWVSE